MRLPTCLLLALTLMACSGTPKRPLYQELGGEAGVTLIVEDLLFRVLDNPRISHLFADSDMLRLREKLIEQICAESDGPCTYSGDDMQTAHAGRNITDADFNALVEDLLEVMQARGVPVAAQNRLIKRLAPMHGDIVYR